MRRPPRDALVEPTADLSKEEVLRYARHLSIPEIGRSGQQRLASAKVVCVGAGGLGSPILMYLAAAGIGTLGIVEFDTVDESNLQRQIIHRQSRVGRSKLVSASQTIRELNPNVRVVAHELPLAEDNAREIFEGYDLIIDGSDNFATRYLINDVAAMLRKPYVWGAVHQFSGQAAVFWAGHGPCYRCLYPQPPDQETAGSGVDGGADAGGGPDAGRGPGMNSGVLGAVCASIGAIQATEAIKLLTGVGDTLLGSIMVYDALAMTFRKLALRRDPDCPTCWHHTPGGDRRQ